MTDAARPPVIADEPNLVEEAAGEKLGIRKWDRPTIFRETAEAATDSDLAYWTVLVLSGAIATLGLALNSSAVVIGAMLVAPLLAPVVGLALALAVGDGRLAVQTGAVVLGSTIAVVLTAAILTALLPFHTITLEISARTRPTTLDLAIAIFSGLAGAVVSVARGHRLSAAIPGVAISVALIPPLAVAGFGVGIGWNGTLIWGALLLYGANLAGIVLSGMGVFLLVGMQRSDVLSAARTWHETDPASGLAAWAGRARWVRSLGVFSSPWARVGLVAAFAVALGFPLTETLAQISREARVDEAVQTAAKAFEIPGEASLLGQQVDMGRRRTHVYLRVATARGFGPAEREEFERTASALAGEPVRLSLEQLPATNGDIEELRDIFPGGDPRTGIPPPAPPPATLGDLVSATRLRLREAMETVSIPDGTTVVGTRIAAATSGESTATISYLAAEPLPPQAEQMLAAQVRRAVALPGLRVRLRFIPAAPRTVAAASQDTASLREIVAVLRDEPAVVAEILAPVDGDTAGVAAVAARLAGDGVAPSRISTRSVPGEGSLQVRLRAAHTVRSPSSPAETGPGTRTGRP